MENTTTSPEATTEAQATESVDTSVDTTEATVVADNGETVSETSYLDGKYKSVGDLEDAYRNLQSSYSTKLGAFDGAPEEYTLPEGELAGADQANLAFLQQWGKENQLSNDGLNSFAEGYSQMQTQQRTAQIDAAYKELGENADRRLANVRDYLTKHLGEEGTKALAANMNDAASIQAIEALISKTKGAAPANVPSTQAYTKEGLEKMRFAKDEHGARKMDDPAYRKAVNEYAAKVVGGTSGYKQE